MGARPAQFIPSTGFINRQSVLSVTERERPRMLVSTLTLETAALARSREVATMTGWRRMWRSSRERPPAGSEVAATFLQWTFLRAVCHRGHVLVASLYFILDAHLSASQLLLLGSVVAATIVLADIPTGIW